MQVTAVQVVPVSRYPLHMPCRYRERTDCNWYSLCCRWGWRHSDNMPKQNSCNRPRSALVEEATVAIVRTQIALPETFACRHCWWACCRILYHTLIASLITPKDMRVQALDTLGIRVTPETIVWAWWACGSWAYHNRIILGCTWGALCGWWACITIRWARECGTVSAEQQTEEGDGNQYHF